MASEAKFHSLFEFAPEAIEAVNRDGHITLVNTKTESLFGYTRDELLGRSLLDPAVTQSVLNRMKRLASGHQLDEINALSAQVRKVLALVAEGKTNKEIANDLDLSDKTVKNYLSNIFTKLNLSRRAEAAAYFVRHRPSGSQRD